MKMNVIKLSVFMLFTLSVGLYNCDKDSNSSDNSGFEIFKSSELFEIQVSSLYGDNGYTTMTINRNSDGEVNIETSSIEPPMDASREVTIFDLEVNPEEDYMIVDLSNVDEKIWLVPMNPDDIPMQVGGGGTGGSSNKVKITCDCTGSGKCIISGVGTTVTCEKHETSPCNKCCKQTTVVTGINYYYSDTYVLIYGEAINFNGVLYN